MYSACNIRFHKKLRTHTNSGAEKPCHSFATVYPCMAFCILYPVFALTDYRPCSPFTVAVKSGRVRKSGQLTKKINLCAWVITCRRKCGHSSGTRASVLAVCWSAPPLRWLYASLLPRPSLRPCRHYLSRTGGCSRLPRQPAVKFVCRASATRTKGAALPTRLLHLWMHFRAVSARVRRAEKHLGRHSNSVWLYCYLTRLFAVLKLWLWYTCRWPRSWKISYNE